MKERIVRQTLPGIFSDSFRQIDACAALRLETHVRQPERAHHAQHPQGSTSVMGECKGFAGSARSVMVVRDGNRVAARAMRSGNAGELPVR